MARAHANLSHGAAVFSADGRRLGDLHAVVVDPRDNEVTHVVVNAGPHFPEPGFGAPRLVEVDAGLLAEASPDRVTLSVGSEEFAGLPDYVERDYIPATPEEGGAEGGGVLRVLWNAGAALAGALASIGGIGVPRETFRRARFERHILNDAPVWRRQPHEQIGEVERVLVNEETDEIEALVIRRGFLFPHEVVLPVDYVTEILDGVVHVEIGDEELKGLAKYEG